MDPFDCLFNAPPPKKSTSFMAEKPDHMAHVMRDPFVAAAVNGMGGKIVDIIDSQTGESLMEWNDGTD